MTKEQIYERMTVKFVEPDPDIPYEFEDGKPCEELYGKVCDARLRLSERTGIDFEDRDLMDVIENLEQIATVLANMGRVSVTNLDHGTGAGRVVSGTGGACLHPR